MREFKNFKKYEPHDLVMATYTGGLDSGHRVVFLESDEGYCWYVARLLFREDTLKIGYDKTGAIHSIATEADRMFPTGLSVVEIDPALAPEGLCVGGWWLWDGEKIVRNETQDVAWIATMKRRRIAAAVEAMTPLSFAVELGEATEDDVANLTDWKRYMISLHRIDASKPQAVVWPTAPRSRDQSLAN